ncbi:hypothetical protein HQ865_12820 [Mucilaginibacter mali]|uniref:Uncharacterized protein n=1 Tax=Mucilaginibacter mali TaxID=2740462 RepID=A0A7D4UKF9_9SPHI|nr:hypothetical protein [Mucilaginibacter mali]QKJ30602.1 hypothetical protein HQ865_12820 [Mucilaginibacter mali]
MAPVLLHRLRSVFRIAGCFCIAICSVLYVQAQDKGKPKFSISGDMGVWYESYNLNRWPGQSLPVFYQPRKPWNMLRYNFSPVFSFGKWTVPFNFNFTALQNNFITPVTSGKQSLWQFITNPANNFGVSPKFGTTEILLGTQYIHYSDLSTGDLGTFGYGVNLSPGKFRFKFFQGVSQRPVNYIAPTIIPPDPGVPGAYQRNHWMAQLGLEENEKYFVGFNFSKAKDDIGSVTSAPQLPVTPQDNMVVTFLAKANTKNGWNVQLELGQSFHTRDLNTPLSLSPVEDFKPFIESHTSTVKNNAIVFALAKKKDDWEAGIKFNYYGSGYYTAGYPFLANDRMDYLANTRFSIINKNVNIVASAGQRLGNLSNSSGTGVNRQFIANVNVSAQVSEHFSLNSSFNNLGYNAADASGYRSVSNEFSINPVYNWSTASMSHMISGTYTRSQYDETTIIPPGTTRNNTQTALLQYVPTFFKGKLSPDISLMWFKNIAPPVDLTLMNATASLGWKAGKKFNVKSQLQYNLTTTAPFTANKNVLLSGGFDWELYKRLTWQILLTGNLYHYGTELPGNTLTPPYAGLPRYLESTVRSSLNYRFK